MQYPPDWFEQEFYHEKFDRFVTWIKGRNVQIVCMVVNVALIAACIVLMMQNGGITFEFAPLAAPGK